MTRSYAIRLPVAQAFRLGTWRTTGGLEVFEQGGDVWLRIADSSEPLLHFLRAIPDGELFEILSDGQLCPFGHRVPRGFLPTGDWISLSRWLQVELPSAALPGQSTRTVELTLAPGGNVREPNALLTSLELWASYGIEAPQIRLDRWHFAVSPQADVIVRGTPLPPLPGLRLVEEQGVAVPCGQFWTPAIDADLVGSLFGLSGGDFLLWVSTKRRERIASDRFVRASRSAIRASAGANNAL
jgi:MoxR-vWA-beta-propeller ternary system domain bpX2